MTTTPPTTSAPAKPTKPTKPPTDTRRITESDEALARLKTRTVRQLTQSMRQLVRDLKSGAPASQAQSHFIDRHLALLRAAYRAAHAEGQLDYYQGVSATPRRWATHEPDTATLNRRMSFYAPSVARMAHEATRAYEAPPTVAKLDDSAANAYAANLGARLSLQADLTWAGGQDGYVEAGWADSAANPYGALWWDLEPTAQHCSDCPALAAASPYDPPWIAGGNTLMTTPGDGATECGAGCRCSLRYGDGGSMPMVPQPAQPPDLTAPSPGEDVVVEGPQTVRQQQRNRFPQARTPMTDDQIARLPHVAPPRGDLTSGEQRALDLYREAGRQWAIVRGTLPDLPSWWQMLGLGVDPYSHGPLFPALDQLTPEQRRVIKLLDSALDIWYALSSYTPDLYDLDYGPPQ